MNDNQKIVEDDIVSMLDNFIGKGGGHMNVDVDTLTASLSREIEETKSSDCNSNNMACQVPTLHTGLDAEE